MLKYSDWQYTYRQLPNHFYSDVMPAKMPDFQLVILNEPLIAPFGFDTSYFSSDEGLAQLSGYSVPENMKPFAQAYAGHQFGHLTMLGDGRAIVMGELLDVTGQRYDWQWKGSGQTPYSRRGDGKAALGPMLREYIISEAMHALGIPTTRSIAVFKTGEMVRRESLLPGAVLIRLAKSHLRVGTFAYAAHFSSIEDVRILADYAIERHDSDLMAHKEKYLLFVQRVVDRQATLIAQWMQVGFIHGVMNTDNMTISGETIDYGPCAFMDRYDPATVFSSIDSQGRYAYGMQPAIGQWNVARFIEMVLPLLSDNDDEALDIGQRELDRFWERYQTLYYQGMTKKLGLHEVTDEATTLINGLLDYMHQNGLDYTNTFRRLSQNVKVETVIDNDDWVKRWMACLDTQGISLDDARDLMKQLNPAVIARNHKVEEVLLAAQRGDMNPLHHLLVVLSHPFDDVDDEGYTKPGDLPITYRTFCGT